MVYCCSDISGFVVMSFTSLFTFSSVWWFIACVSVALLLWILVNVSSCHHSCHHCVKLGDSCRRSLEFWEWGGGWRRVCVPVAALEGYRMEIMTSTFTIHAHSARAALCYTQMPHKAPSESCDLPGPRWRVLFLGTARLDRPHWLFFKARCLQIGSVRRENAGDKGVTVFLTDNDDVTVSPCHPLTSDSLLGDIRAWITVNCQSQSW